MQMIWYFWLRPISHLSKMLEICTEFANEINLSFNANKSVYMIFDNKKCEQDYVIFNNVAINSSVSTKYLGHVVSSHDCTIDFMPALSEYIGKVNYVNYSFKYLPYDLKYKLCKLLGHSLYGCEVWKIDDRMLEKIDVTWRKCVRKIIVLPGRCHSRYLSFIVNDLGLQQVVYNRVIKFSQNCFKTNANVKVLKLMNLAWLGSNSCLGENISLFCMIYDCDRNMLKEISKQVVIRKSILSNFNKLQLSFNCDDIERTVELILALLDERDYIKETFSREECDSIICFLSTG